LKNPQKLQLDRTLFAAAAFVLNGLTRLLGRVLRRDHSVRQGNVRVIVLAKLVGLGSLIQSTVLLRSLRVRYPEARIVYFTLDRNAEMCRRLPGVDDVVSFDDSGLRTGAATVIAALWRLARMRVDLYFDLEVYSHLASILATLSMARNRYGFFRQSCRFKQGLHTHLLYLNCFRHITEAYAQMARLAGADPEIALIGPKLTDTDRLVASGFLERARGGEPSARYLALNANASDLLLERRWTARNWSRLIEHLAERESRLRFLLIGGPDEKEYLEREIVAHVPEVLRSRVTIAAGTLSLFETMALLERCEALVTNDSGPMHFAFALGVPAVTLWGPGLPAHYGPLEGMNARVLYAGIYCSPCLYHTEPAPCRGDNQCMQAITVGEVEDAVADVIGLAAGPPRREPSGKRILPVLGVVARADR
jgi:ADP-heptose:LPS heptosyltransferase